MVERRLVEKVVERAAEIASEEYGINILNDFWKEWAEFQVTTTGSFEGLKYNWVVSILEAVRDVLGIKIGWVIDTARAGDEVEIALLGTDNRYKLAKAIAVVWELDWGVEKLAELAIEYAKQVQPTMGEKLLECVKEFEEEREKVAKKCLNLIQRGEIGKVVECMTAFQISTLEKAIDCLKVIKEETENF